MAARRSSAKNLQPRTGLTVNEISDFFEDDTVEDISGDDSGSDKDWGPGREDSGRHSSKQFIRGKPIRFGYKVWALCTDTGAGGSANQRISAYQAQPPPGQ